MTRTYYQILGCLPDATEHDIKRAYRRLSKRYHPDLNPNDPKAEERFIEMQNAYEVLGDPESRAVYDFMLTQPSTAAANTTTAYTQGTYTQTYYPPPPKRPFVYAFVPGIGITLFIAVFRMIGDYQMSKIQSSKFTYTSVRPASPVFNNKTAGSDYVFQPGALPEVERVYYGQVMKLAGRLEYRFLDNDVGETSRAAFVLTLHTPVTISGSPVVRDGKKITTVYLVLDRKQQEQFLGLTGKNIVVMATLQRASTISYPADAVGENVSVR